MTSLKVESNEVGMRLDLFLTFKLPQFSRSSVKKMLDTGKVSRNSETEYRPNYRVQLSDNIEIDMENDMQRRRLPSADIPVDVLYRDKDLLLVDKPSGLKVHPSMTDEHNTLLNAVYGLLGDDVSSFGVNLINRIDQGTSGIVALALSPQGAWYYAKQFAEGKTEKTYLMLVSGKWAEKYGTEEVKVSNFLVYDSNLKRSRISATEGEHALTFFKMLKLSKDKRVALLQANPKTGRTHQLRVQLSHLGFPIWGDTKYGGAKYSRLMLHAYALGLPKYNEEGRIEVTCGIPQEFEQLLTNEK